jgi:hypothetical protein
MLESGLSGSVRGVPSNGHPYRDPGSKAAYRSSALMSPSAKCGHAATLPPASVDEPESVRRPLSESRTTRFPHSTDRDRLP